METKSLLQLKRYNLLPFEHEFRLYAHAVIGLTPVSIKNYISDYRYFVQWLDAQFSPLTVEHADVHHIELYRSYLVEQGLPRASVNRRLSALRALYTFLIHQGIISSSPMKSIKNMTQHTSDMTASVMRSSSPTSINPLISKFCDEQRSLGIDQGTCSRNSKYIEEFLAITHFEFIHETA